MGLQVQVCTVFAFMGIPELPTSATAQNVAIWCIKESVAGVKNMRNITQKQCLENRNEPRKPYSGHIFFAAKEGVCEGRLKNFSRYGLFIETGLCLAVGEIISIALPYAEAKAGKIRGQIMWRNKKGVGVELFRRPKGSNLRVVL